MAQSTSQHLSRSYTDCSLHSPDHGSFHFPPSPFNQPHSATFCCQPIATLLSNFKTALLPAAVISGHHATLLDSILFQFLIPSREVQLTRINSPPHRDRLEPPKTFTFSILNIATHRYVHSKIWVSPDWNTYYMNMTWHVLSECWYDMYDVYKSDEDLWLAEPSNTDSDTFRCIFLEHSVFTKPHGFEGHDWVHMHVMAARLICGHDNMWYGSSQSQC